MNIIRTSIAFALSIAAMAAQAQHEVTLSIDGDDLAALSIVNTGLRDVAAVELVAGSGAVFGLGTAGDLSWSHQGVTTISAAIRPGEIGTFAINLDGATGIAVTSPLDYIGARALVLWTDGFEATIPMGRGLGGGVFTFTDIPPPIPEPESYALMLAGLALVGAVAARKTGGAA